MGAELNCERTRPPRTADPTPAEIAEACERIRSCWTEAELRRRGKWAYEREIVEYRPVSVVNGDDSEKDWKQWSN